MVFVIWQHDILITIYFFLVSRLFLISGTKKVRWSSYSTQYFFFAMPSEYFTISFHISVSYLDTFIRLLSDDFLFCWYFCCNTAYSSRICLKICYSLLFDISDNKSFFIKPYALSCIYIPSWYFLPIMVYTYFFVYLGWNRQWK